MLDHGGERGADAARASRRRATSVDDHLGHGVRGGRLRRRRSLARGDELAGRGVDDRALDAACRRCRCRTPDRASLTCTSSRRHVAGRDQRYAGRASAPERADDACGAMGAVSVPARAEPPSSAELAVELAIGAAERRPGRRRRRTVRSSPRVDADRPGHRGRPATSRPGSSAARRRRPDDAVLGEEGGGRAGTSGVRWVLDPIDGTVNFVLGLPQYAVSVAAEVDGAGRRGAVCNPVSRRAVPCRGRRRRLPRRDRALARAARRSARPGRGGHRLRLRPGAARARQASRRRRLLAAGRRHPPARCGQPGSVRGRGRAASTPTSRRA